MHEAPVRGCRCGLYAMKELVPLVSGSMERSERLRFAVYGRARLWGRTFIAPHGWRAQYGRVVELRALPGQERMVRELAALYTVDVGPTVDPRLVAHDWDEQGRYPVKNLPT